MQTSMFYNTIDLAGDDLKRANIKAVSQEDKVLSFFRLHNTEKFTPFQIQRHVMPGSPVTSTRRALTNLTKEGLLTKLDEKKEEQYGEKNHYWMLTNRL